MDRHAVALVLSEIATLLEIHGENKFKVRAYAAAARAIEAADEDVEALARAGRLEELPGIGSATRAVVEELVRTGQSRMHQRLREKTPSGFYELLRVPRLGPGRIHTLHEELGIETVAELEAAAKEGRVADLKGFGPKTQAAILEGIAFVRGSSSRRLLPRADEAVYRLLGFLEGHPAVRDVRLAGPLRRRLETVEGADVLAAVPGRCDALLDAFLRLPGLARAERAGDDAATGWLSDGFQLRVRCVSLAAFAAAWAHETGSPEHVAALAERAGQRGLELRADGLFRKGKRVRVGTEEALYGKLGLAWVPPELREGLDEVERAGAGTLPELLGYEDLRGCFHNHTTASDGAETVAGMAEAALARGWRYLGIADHSQFAGYAGGLDADALRRQADDVRAWNEARGDEVWVFHGVEADILADGTVDLADTGVLAELDYVVGSVHSSFRLPEPKQTARVLRALDEPTLTFLGHATGRLLLRREGYALDVDAVMERAAERGVAIEINANPNRMDLDWRWWRRAAGSGLRTAINPDAHTIRELDNVGYGVGVARKGGLAAADVVNAWPLEEARAWLKERRA